MGACDFRCAFITNVLMNMKIGLAASLGYGAASEIIRRTGSDANDSQSSIMMTEANIKRLVSKLSQMRGAALKLGQFLSIQGKLETLKYCGTRF